MTNLLSIVTDSVTKILIVKYNKDKLKNRLTIMLLVVTKIAYIRQNERPSLVTKIVT